MTKKTTHYYCKKFGDLSMRLCHKSPYNDDDWDELEDPCVNCGWRTKMEIEMETFQVKCKKDWPYIKDRYKARAGEMVEAYVNGDILVVGGLMTSMDEFNEYFEKP